MKTQWIKQGNVLTIKTQRIGLAWYNRFQAKMALRGIEVRLCITGKAA